MSRRVKTLEKNSGGTITSEKRFVWSDGNQPAEERNSSNTTTVRYFAHGEQRVGASSPADKLFYTFDHLNSVRELVDDDEVVRARYGYDLWGNTTKLSGDLDTIVGYTGHHFHTKSGFYQAMRRLYSSEWGRFFSRDPIAEDGGINLYAYVDGDPINFYDPDGLKFIRAINKIHTIMQDEAASATEKAVAILKTLGASNRQAANMANASINNLKDTQSLASQWDDSSCPTVPDDLTGILTTILKAVLDDASEGAVWQPTESNYREGWWEDLPSSYDEKKQNFRDFVKAVKNGEKY